MPQFGRYAPPTHTLVHLSDPHLLAGGVPLGGRFDVDASLQRCLAAVERAGAGADALVVTGDLADLGEPDAYRRLRAAVDPVAERLGAPVVWVAGNHDERPALRAHLLGEAPTDSPVTGVREVSGLRIVTLDSTVPGWHHGDVDEGQREWLAEVLSRPAEHGTILAMHHPPVPSHLPFFDILELRHQDELADVLRGTDVRAILAGHLHYSLHGSFAGIPVSVASATCYTMDVASPAQRVNGMGAAQSFQLVHVRPETITHTVVPVVEAEADGFFSPEWVEEMGALTPQERLEAFSRKPGG